jgi:hypothetical protein
MLNTLVHQIEGPIDSENARHIRATEALLEQGDVSAACQELRKISRRVAGTGAVISLRRRLVEAVLGINELQPVS